MATIRQRGENTFQIRVSTGYDTKARHKEQSMTWKAPEGMTKNKSPKNSTDKW